MRQTLKKLVTSGLLIALASCASQRELDENDMNCPDSPNCVSSLASDSAHFIAPLTFNDQPQAAMQRLKAALLSEKRVTIVKEQTDYLHAEVRSLIFRFVDDVEFTLVLDQGAFQVRSSSRVGYSDFGVNRRRLERIRQLFQK
ncbi:MAG: hypothetical protein ACI85N_001122 [Gammaproteobacteria bacterium]|jgi:uncharacterized protein (DUF1499 family)